MKAVAFPVSRPGFLNFVDAMSKSSKYKDELLNALNPMYMGMSVSESRPILENLLSNLTAARSELGPSGIIAICDEFLKAEVRATSLNALLVSYLNRFPVELGDVCDKCLSCLIYDSVACGASRGRLSTIRVSESVAWKVELGEFYEEWTGCRVWPGAVHISKMLLGGRYPVANEDVLELGSGLGTCGIATMHAGSRSTTFTEYKQSLLELCISNADRNQPVDSPSNHSGFILDWSDFDSSSSPGFQEFRSRVPQDFVVIGSELVYEDIHGDMLIRVLEQLFRSGASRGLIVVMLKPSRPGVAKFLESLRTLPRSSSFRVRIEEEPSDDDELAACIYLDRAPVSH